MRRMLLAVMSIGACAVPAVARAGPLGTAIPANCTAHQGWDAGEADAPGDYRCAGLAIPFHTAGVGRSPGPIWAGQWLFVDDAGQYHVGSCTFNRGVHPNVLGPSAPVAQPFPDDPTGAKGAYLGWRYGDTTDDLTAAAMWAVFHFYAQDAAGTRRADDPGSPLIPSLDSVAAMSGRADVETRAQALDAEAQAHSTPWQLDIAVSLEGMVSVSVMSGETPIIGANVMLSRDGHDSLPVTTGDDGRVSTVIVAEPGPFHLTASTSAPGSVAVYRGPPAEPNPYGAQTLATAGAPAVLVATAAVDIPTPTTAAAPPSAAPTTTPATVEDSTTTTVTTTTLPATTTSAPATTTTSTVELTTTSATTTTTSVELTDVPTTVVPTTEASTTTTTAVSTTTPVQADDLDSTTTALAATTSQVGTTSPGLLPATGGDTDPPAFVGTALLVGGIGLIGTIRRRTRRIRTPYFDADA